MAEDIFIPKLGQTVEQVTLVRWLVKDGDCVQAGQPLLSVETDKAIFDVEATSAGEISLGKYQAGDVVPVLTVVACIGKRYTPNLPELVRQPQMTVLPTPANESTERIFATPLARKIARDNNLDLRDIAPTGKRASRLVVLAGDVRKVVASASHPVALASSSAEPVKGEKNPVASMMPLSGVRAVIAQRMVASTLESAAVTLTTEVNATKLVKLRKHLKKTFGEIWGYSPGYLDILARFVTMSLSVYPYMNARLVDDTIELVSEVNLGIAVDTPRGLIVPVIRQANSLPMALMGRAIREMAERARQGSSSPDELQGGTFTITNLGAYEVGAFTPIINLPEVAILGIGQIAPKVVASKKRKAVVRDVLALSLTFDHRAVDGAPAARFLQHLKGLIEDPWRLIGQV